MIPNPKGQAPRARARRSDPITSHLTAEEMNATGLARAQRAVAYRYVHEHEGLTSRELAHAFAAQDPVMFLHKYDMLKRRLPELRDSGWLMNGVVRECRLSHRRALTWWLVNPRTDRQIDLFDTPPEVNNP